MTDFTVAALYGAAMAVHQQEKGKGLQGARRAVLGEVSAVELSQLEAQKWAVELSIHQAGLMQVAIPILIIPRHHRASGGDRPVLDLRLAPSMSQVRMSEVEGPQYADQLSEVGMYGTFLKWLQEQDSLAKYEVPQDPRLGRELQRALKGMLDEERENRGS